jgi:hypothetical protein
MDAPVLSQDGFFCPGHACAFPRPGFGYSNKNRNNSKILVTEMAGGFLPPTPSPTLPERLLANPQTFPGNAQAFPPKKAEIPGTDRAHYPEHKPEPPLWTIPNFGR